MAALTPSPTLPTVIAAAAVAIFSLLLHFLLPYSPTLTTPTPHPALLNAIAADEFAWGKSTTDIPISTVSVHAKALLSRDADSLPTYLHHLLPSPSSTDDTIRLQPVRDALNARRLHRIRTLCQSLAVTNTPCDPNYVHPTFRQTPLHLAASTNDTALYKFLLTLGATPRPDSASRLPKNLTFANFLSNARRAAAPNSDCQLPIVDFAANPTNISAALREARRLIFEGEPVLLRGAYAHYATALNFPYATAWNISTLLSQYAETPVTVGAVPYANAFNLSTTTMTLTHYHKTFVRNAPPDQPPLYVFNKNAAISAQGYTVLSTLISDALSSLSPPLVTHPDRTGATDGIHFFLGRPQSGAPFHVHADAVNAAVHGRKRWFVHTPARTVYSRKTIARWVEEDLPGVADEDRPLECVQHPGDVVYVPLDWGHAVLNLDEDTFGVALEILNRRDTLAHITGHVQD